MGTQLNWDFVSSHFVEIVKRFGDDGITSFGVKNIIRSSFENFAAAPILERTSYLTFPSPFLLTLLFRGVGLLQDQARVVSQPHHSAGH